MTPFTDSRPTTTDDYYRRRLPTDYYRPTTTDDYYCFGLGVVFVFVFAFVLKKGGVVENGWDPKPAAGEQRF